MNTSTYAASARRRFFPSVTLSSAKMMFFALLVGSTAYANNDNLRDALVLDPGGRVSVDVANFKTEDGENLGNNNYQTAWFVWTAPATPPKKVRFSTYGSNYNTVENLFIHDPTKELLYTSLTPVAVGGPGEALVINDDDANVSGGTGYMEWVPTANVTYYISVGRNVNTNPGNSRIFDATFGVVTDSANVDLIPNDLIANASALLAGTTVAGTTIGAIVEANEASIPSPTAPNPPNATTIAGGTVWYSYTPLVNGIFTVAVTDIASDTVGETILQAFTNTAATIAGLTPINKEDKQSSLVSTPRLVISGTAGTTYYFRVSSTDGDGTNFNIRLDTGSPAPIANDSYITTPGITPTGPIVVGPALPIVQQGDNYSATEETFPNTNPGYGAPGNGFTNNVVADVWYLWKAPASGQVKLRAIAPTSTATTGNFEPDCSTFSFAAQVFYDTSSPGDTLLDTNTTQRVGGFNNGNPATTGQTLTFYAQKDVVYFIEIGSNTNKFDRGFFTFVLENATVTDIARTGVSYGSEGVLKTINSPVVNKDGDVAFQATLELGGPVTAAKDTALYLFNGTTKAAVVEGQPEFQGQSGILFGTFSNLFLADRTIPNPNQPQVTDPNPDLGFNATLTGSSTVEPLSSLNNKGFYHGDPTNANSHVRELRTNNYLGASYTWQDGAAFLGSFNTPVRVTGNTPPGSNPSINNGNAALFTGKMVGIPAARDTGLFTTTGAQDTGRVVVQEEDPAPNTLPAPAPGSTVDPATQDGAEFGDQTGTPTVNSSNNLAFRATLRGTGVTSANDAAIYSVVNYTAAPTALNYLLRLRKGSTAAGPNNTPLASGALLFSLGEPRINGKGKIALTAGFKPGGAVTASNDTAILSDLVSTDYSFAIVAREGDFAPVIAANGALVSNTAKFVSFTSPVLITNNAVVFSAKVAGAGISAANNTGIWLWDGANTHLIAQTGTPAQGLLPRTQTAQAPKYKTLGAPLANLAGRVSFTGSISGPGVTAANDTGLWTIEEDGTVPFLRLREGNIYNFDSIELPFRRTVTSISVTAGSGGDDGFARGMDQDGNVAVTVGLNKGKAKSGQAVFKLTP